jgi:GT2 family glycosyltransferase
MGYPEVSIIILNWNRWKDTIECLESLYQITYLSYRVIVVDNGSKDGSIERIKEFAEGRIKVSSKYFEYDLNNKPIRVLEYGKKEAEAGGGREKDILKVPPNKSLILIRGDKNYGFAGGNNVAIRYALKALNPDYILLLNNDTVVDKEFLEMLVKIAEEDERIGIVGPKIYYYDHCGRSDVISFTGETISSWKGVGKRYGCGEIDRAQWDKPMEVDKVEGSCMLIRREVFERIGLFDEKFFLYWEETDFCVRAKRAGFKVVYCPQARVWHKVARSMGGGMSYTRVYFLTRNRSLFIAKSFPRNFWKLILYLTFYEIWRKIGEYLLYHRNAEALTAYLKGVIDGYKTATKYRLYIKSRNHAS